MSTVQPASAESNPTVNAQKVKWHIEDKDSKVLPPLSQNLKLKCNWKGRQENELKTLRATNVYSLKTIYTKGG